MILVVLLVYNKITLKRYKFLPEAEMICILNLHDQYPQKRKYLIG